MSLNFDRTRVICISLKSHNEQQLFSISEYYSISFEVLLKVKQDGFTKIWVESNGNWIISCVHESQPETMIVKEIYNPLTKKDRDFLLRQKPIKTPKMPKNEESKYNYQLFLEKGFDIKTKSLDMAIDNSTNKSKKNQTESTFFCETESLDLDDILDKISKYGMNSLTKNEKDFLENLSKQ